MQMQFTLAPEPDDITRERGRLLFAAPVEFLKGVVAMSGMPPGDRLEVCFAGRSNVGKSSLINALTNRKNLARASNTPGRTQEINFFTTTDGPYLVDLPGYGFAEAPVFRLGSAVAEDDELTNHLVDQFATEAKERVGVGGSQDVVKVDVFASLAQ